MSERRWVDEVRYLVRFRPASVYIYEMQIYRKISNCCTLIPNVLISVNDHFLYIVNPRFNLIFQYF